MGGRESEWDENGVVDGVAGDDRGGVGGGWGWKGWVGGRHESGVIDGVNGNDGDGGTGRVGRVHGHGWLARERNDRQGHEG